MSAITYRKAIAADGPAMGAAHIAAYWEDENWRLIWSHKTREYVSAQSSKRYSMNLLTDREHRRVEVAVDEKTGRLVGYARWCLPDSLASSSEWLEAQVPGVSKEDEDRYAASHASADWKYRSELDVLDVEVGAALGRLQSKHEYMELEFLAVDPEFKGRGVATGFVERGMAEATKMGVRIFVMAMPAALGLYKRAGFQLLDEVERNDAPFGGPGKHSMYFLEWVPQTEKV